MQWLIPISKYLDGRHKRCAEVDCSRVTYFREHTSSTLKFFMPKARMNSTSTAVMSTPPHSGMLNSRLSAVAEPMISARSVAAIATSARTQRMYTTHCKITYSSFRLYTLSLWAKRVDRSRLNMKCMG